MEVRRVLQELVAIPEQPEPVASVYLNTWFADEHQREAVRVFVAENVRRAIKARPDEEARLKLAATFRPVEAYVAALLRQRVDEGATGVALFASAPLGLFRVVATRVPFEPMELRLEKRPYVVPIVRTLAATPDVIVAAVDSEGGTLLESDGGMADLEAQIDRPFPGFHKQGGWRQRRIGRHLGELRERNLRSVADPLIRLSDARPGALLVLSGQHFILPLFEALLPARVVARVVARVPFPSASSEGEMRRQLMLLAAEGTDRAVQARLEVERDQLVAEAARSGLGVVGVPGTLQAIREGRAHRILVEKGFDAQGYRCQSCGALLEGASACAYCGGAARAVSFPEDLVRGALATDAAIEFLPAGMTLPKGAGVAAHLRHRGAAGAHLAPPFAR